MSENIDYKTALNKSMTLCSRKEYCRSEIRLKLESWGAAATEAEKVLNALEKENFINESRYAAAFTSDKFKYNKWGKVKIAANLKYKKIPAEIIRDAIESIDYTSYRAMLEKLLNDHRRKIKARNEYDLKAKLMRFALSKGFEQSLVYEILSID